MPSWCASISATSLRRKKPRKRTSLPRLRARSLRPGRVFRRPRRRLPLWLPSPRRLPRLRRQQDPEVCRQVLRLLLESRVLSTCHRQRRLREFVPQLSRPALRPLRRGPELFRPRHRHRLLRLRDQLEQHLRHQHPGLACRCVLQDPARCRERLWERVLRLQRPVHHVLREHRLPRNDFLSVPAPLRVRAKAVPARLRACVQLERHNSIARVARRKVVLAAHPASVPAGRLHDSRRVLAVVAVRAVVTIKLPWAGSVPAREYQKLNRASRSMPANLRRVAGHSSRSVTRKASASYIQFDLVQAWARAAAQPRLSPLRL